MDNPETRTMLGTRHRTNTKNKKKKKQERKIHRVDTQNSQKENTDVNPGARER
jgi:hypothetical protein